MTDEIITNEYQEKRIDREGRGMQDAVSLYEEPKSMALFDEDPEKALTQMQKVVQVMSNKCTGPQFISQIKGKNYPRVEWWTTVGATLGLFPVTRYSKRLDRDDEITYEARVEVMRGDRVITAGEAICSSKENQWKSSDEYAIKSMAITRATGKAYRTGLSMLAVMAGLEGTPAEEMSGVTQSFSDKKDDKPWLNEADKKHWMNAEKAVTSGKIEPKELRDHYKVSKANMAHFERLKERRMAEIDEEFDKQKLSPEMETFAEQNPDLPF